MRTFSPRIQVYEISTFVSWTSVLNVTHAPSFATYFARRSLKVPGGGEVIEKIKREVGKVLDEIDGW